MQIYIPFLRISHGSFLIYPHFELQKNALFGQKLISVRIFKSESDMYLVYLVVKITGVKNVSISNRRLSLETNHLKSDYAIVGIQKIYKEENGIPLYRLSCQRRHTRKLDIKTRFVIYKNIYLFVCFQGKFIHVKGVNIFWGF